MTLMRPAESDDEDIEVTDELRREVARVYKEAFEEMVQPKEPPDELDGNRLAAMAFAAYSLRYELDTNCIRERLDDDELFDALDEYVSVLVSIIAGLGAPPFTPWSDEYVEVAEAIVQSARESN
jgi:hypothetical protein